ncbi:HNH endonuclease signature motif containing protein [Agromyces subbeticus]|uniref:HNH endonuclease signature motif containing protein n=1 Tax=Agromyces subbeticus TaxID=293890 RepID=UPI003CCB8601
MSVLGRRVRVHRWVYELANGPIAHGDVIDHVQARGCGSTLCCNPAHLESVSVAENTRRGRLARCARLGSCGPFLGRGSWCQTCTLR